MKNFKIDLGKGISKRNHFDSIIRRGHRLFSRIMTQEEGDESLLKPRLVWTKLLIGSIIGSVSVGSLYALFAEIDEVAIVPGELKPAGNVSIVKSATNGVVESLLAKDGEIVRKDQPVIRLFQEVASSRRDSLVKQLDLTRGRVRDSESTYAARSLQLESQRSSLVFTANTQASIVKRYKPLVAIGAIQEVQYLEQLNRLNTVKSEVDQVNSKISELRSSYLQSIKDLNSTIASIQSQLEEAEMIARYQVIKSPVSGRIFDMKPKRPGYVTSAGEPLFTVVPDNRLEANLVVTNQYIGFLKVGMNADVRVDAYPFTEYGSVKGRLTSISSDALAPDQQIPVPRFSAIVKLEKQFLTAKGKQYPLLSGQTVSVNLILRKRKLASLFTDVIDKSFDTLRSVRTQ